MTEDPSDDVVARTKADPNRSYREDALVAIIEQLRAQIEALKVDLVEARWHGEQPAP